MVQAATCPGGTGGSGGNGVIGEATATTLPGGTGGRGGNGVIGEVTAAANAVLVTITAAKMAKRTFNAL